MSPSDWDEGSSPSRRKVAGRVAAIASVLMAAGLLGWDSDTGVPGTSVRAAPDRLSDAELHRQLRRLCAECHSGAKAEAGWDVASAWSHDRRRLEKIDRALARGAMPPAEAAIQPSDAERDALRVALAAKIEAAKSIVPRDPGRVGLRRLNRVEYANAVRDLIGVSISPRELPDDEVGHGFDTVGDVLTVPPLWLEKALKVAEKAAQAAIPIYGTEAQTIQAENAAREGSGHNAHGIAYLLTPGSFSGHARVERPGRYAVSARVFGQQAGPDLVAAAILVDGRQAAQFEVKAVQATPETLRVEVDLEPGRRQITVAFLNDYYNPDAADPSARDRNMAVDWMRVEGPIRPEGEALGRPGLIPRLPQSPKETRAAAEEALKPLLTRAFRREISKSEIKRYADLVVASAEAGESFERGLQVALAAILLSPNFIYKIELPAKAEAIEALSDFELASRLSFFLWSSLPDEAMLDLARQGKLRQRLRDEARRALEDPKSFALVENFAGQWLQWRRLDELRPDRARFPNFDEALRQAFRQEGEMFFDAILRERRPATDLLFADFSFVNGRLAAHYGIPGVTGDRWRRVRLPAERRGLLGQAAILAITSNPTRSSPVKRGKWILETLLDEPPAPPPPGVDDLKEPEGAQKLSFRQKLELHRQKPECASCHDRLDPLGFSLEHFDPIGKWRLRDGDVSIDAKTELDGLAMDGLPGLLGYLDTRRVDFLRCVAGKLLTFALGRGLIEADHAALAALIDRLGTEATLEDLILGVVELDAFTMKKGESSP